MTVDTVVDTALGIPCPLESLVAKLDTIRAPWEGVVMCHVPLSRDAWTDDVLMIGAKALREHKKL